MFIFYNTIKDHDANICHFFECELVNLNTAKKNLHLIPLRRSVAHQRHFTALRMVKLSVAYRAYGHSGLRACPVPLDSGRPCEAANKKKKKIDTDQDFYRKNGTAGLITDVIQHAIIIRNLVGRLFVQKTAHPAIDGAPLVSR